MDTENIHGILLTFPATYCVFLIFSVIDIKRFVYVFGVIDKFSGNIVVLLASHVFVNRFFPNLSAKLNKFF